MSAARSSKRTAAALLVTTTLAGLAVAGARQDDATDSIFERPAASVEERRALVAEIRSLPEVRPATPQRLIGSPGLSVQPPPRWQPLLRDVQVAREESLLKRAAQRAYAGAPPVMPHSMNYVKTKTCVDCHTDGIWIGNKYGPPMSHPFMASCNQCHVESRNLDLPAGELLAVNSFSGLPGPGGGVRASDVAPPVIPHGLAMRTDCASCHGPESLPGLRTDHPDRLNCVQCHAADIGLDQTSPFFTGRRSMVIPGPEAPDDR